MPLQVGELYAEIDVNQNKFNAGLQDAENKFKNLGNKLDGIGSKMRGIGAGLSMAVTMPIAGVAVASFKMAADMQDAMGAADQIFKEQASNMQSWAKGLKTYYGIASGEALEYSNMMGSMLQNIGGLSEAEAAKQAQTLVELAGDLTAMFGGETSSAVQALTGALKGNNSMLDNYGMAVNEAMVKTKAMEMGLAGEGKELTLAAKQQATLALIMEQTTAAQGQAAREAEGSSGSWRTLTTEMKNLTTSIGDELLPVLTPIIQSVNKMVTAFGNLSPTTKKIIMTFALVAAAIGPLLLVFGMVAGAITAISGALPILGAAFVVITGPIGLVIAAIVAVIAVGVLLIKNWDKVKAFGISMWDAIKTQWNNSAVILKNAMREAGQTIIETWGKIKGAILEAVAAALRFAGATDKAAAVQYEADKAKYIGLANNSSQGGRRGNQTLFGYASGTNSARKGLAWTGENGPELINFNGGEQVLSNRDSMALLQSSALKMDGHSEVTVNHVFETKGTVHHVFHTNDKQVVAQVIQSFQKDTRRWPSKTSAVPFRA